MKRGDLITVALTGDFGKPRPALIIQADQFVTNTVTVLLMSATLVEAPLVRLSVEPTAENGLRKPSQVMIDRSMTLKRVKVGQPFGQLDDQTMLAVTRSLASFFGFGG